MAIDPDGVVPTPRSDPAAGRGWTEIAHANLKAGLLAALALALLAGLLLFVLSARGAFTEMQRIVLVADNAEGVAVGQDLIFSGFPIGRVERIALADDGRARLHVAVPLADARWLKTSSVFTLEVGLVGAAKLRAYTGQLNDAALPDGAQRDVLIGDAAAGIPPLVATMRDVLNNVERLTAAQSPLARSLHHLETLTARLDALALRLDGRHGAADALLGEQTASHLQRTLERTDRLLATADARLFGTSGETAGGGLMGRVEATGTAAQAAVDEVRTLLAETRRSLAKLDAALEAARGVAVNAQSASGDLDVLRDEVDRSLRRVGSLIDSLNRQWPFAQAHELALP